MTNLTGFFTPWIIYAVITLLNYFLPGRRLAGYVRNSSTGELLRYRLNGRLVLIVSAGLWVLTGYLGWIPYDWLYTARWSSLAGAFTFGTIFSLLMVVPQPSTGRNILADLFFGRLENPQIRGGRIDAKVWLYLVGAVMLELNVLSFAAHQYLATGAISPALLLCAAMLTWFVTDYLTFENVHLYTYDFFAERVGFKLGWGCLTFYPYFYLVSVWATVDLADPGTPVWQLVLFGAVFLTGWTLSRGANMQKYFFKTRPDKAFLGMKPGTISDGTNTLLVNGFWGASRHINYLGEILMGCGIALATGYPGHVLVWLYPAYYVALLFTRQADDDRRCAAKYGALWEEYKRRVRYRIVPGVY